MTSSIRRAIAAAIAMLVLILDTRTAVSGAQEGIALCVATVIPSLLPFFVLSILLTASLTGTRSRILSPLGRLLRLPKGSESLFLIGILGGYPTGAQAVADACRNGQLSKSDARRMLGFCSNAGPSFIFGIAAAHFSSPAAAWVLWGIHILSAIITGILLPGGSSNSAVVQSRPVPLSHALDRSLKAMARVCGWIILFRVVIAFLNRWFLWYFDTEGQIAVNGALELTIGCTALSYIQNEGLRFILCAAFLGFGGLCVTMQTMSVTVSSGLGMYLPGKLMQSLFSVLLAAFAQNFLLSKADQLSVGPIFYLITAIIVIILTLLIKKGVAFQRPMVYNPGMIS